MKYIKWLAGIIDSEGSFSMSINNVKRNKYNTIVRSHRLRISTTDDKIIPKAAKILGTNFSDNGYRKTITLTAGPCRKLLPYLIPLLHTKRKAAEIFYEAIKIKNGQNASYSKEESENWLILCSKLSELNKRGKGAWTGNFVDHEFSWEWFAGIIDGDGSITTSKFNNNNLKPYIKIAMTNHHTINHIANNLRKKLPKEDKVNGDRRTTKTIRLMSNDIIEFVPKFIDHLILKKRQAELAYEISILRKDQKTNKMNPKIIIMLEELQKLNNS